jgi:hypothetical protein
MSDWPAATVTYCGKGKKAAKDSYADKKEWKEPTICNLLEFCLQLLFPRPPLLLPETQSERLVQEK